MIPNGGGQVVVSGPSGSITGGTVLTEGRGTMVVGGTGAQITADGVGALTGQKLIDLVNEARTRNDRNAPNVFVCGNGRLIYYAGNQLVNNDTDVVFGTIGPKAGADLVAAGGLNQQGRLVGNDGNGLVGNDGGGLIGNDGGSLVGNDGGSLIGNDGGTLVGNDGGSLIGNDGGTLVGAGAGN